MRIMIFGRAGCGKSTFALELSQKLELPLYHLDRYFFTENWIERNYEEFLFIQRTIITQENWIVDGNAVRSLALRYQRADIALYFCYPRWLCLWRVIKRRFFSEKDPGILDRAPGCHERIRWRLLRYLWTYEDRVKDKVTTLRATYPRVQFHVIRSDQEAKNVMDALTRL